MSQEHRNNPDSEECQRMTRENEQAVFAAKMQAHYFEPGYDEEQAEQAEAEGQDYREEQESRLVDAQIDRRQEGDE